MVGPGLSAPRDPRDEAGTASILPGRFAAGLCL